MRDNDKFTTDISSLYSYYIYQNLIQSLLLRKQGKVHFLVENGSAMISWGLSAFIGGDFSKANGEKVISILDDYDKPLYLYYPDDRWRSFIKSTLSDKLKDRYLNLYQFDNKNITELNDDSECVVQITRNLMENNLPNTELVISELYSYTDVEDFYQNGFGLALVMDGVVSGYCLSEYSNNNSHGINIWIDEQYRGLGYAKKMVNAFLLHCQEKNQSVYWVCNADNITSNKLAVSSGFVLKSTMHYFEL
ncbi:MAG: GNAT family N-acetyltransferase [Clostridia bacterium]|nr:GNAT family N-acetyltransferase [Clostridia bacterium]MBQ7348264.1 GNAT family N-acetyltransferase [Clostridia bacterium]